MLTYAPAPNERAYYGALLQVAAANANGSSQQPLMVQSDAAVAFLTRSKLPIETLKAVWAAADQPVANALDARRFAVAVRLVQLAQHNLPQLAALLAPPQQQSQPIDLAQGFPPNLRPAFFEGIPPPPEAAAATSMPAPPQQQQQQPSGMTGGGSVAGGGASVAGSMVPPQSMAPHTPQQQQQLTVQDPYTLTPAELLRYEQMFPEYCSPNDSHYMYGPEAVALFQKSGLPREALSRIWTLVDTDPVDNRLDPMEFALAMHLIVCVSKKNLPLPTALPPSMAYLKKQQQQQQPEHHRGAAAAGIPPANATHAQQQQHPHPEAPSVLAPSSFPSGQMNMAPSVTMMSMGGGAAASVTSAPPRSVMMAPTAATNNTLSGLAGPPPLTHQVGGLSISDAFEGLGGGGAGDTGSISDYHATNQHSTAHPTTTMAANMEASASSPMHAYSHPPPHQQQQQLSAVTTLEHDDEDEVNGEHAAHRVPVPATVKTTAQLAASYDMGGASEELVKLRNALQKLQAENISLKAKMGSMTDEERDVQKELSATVAEVSNLANELTQTRAQVLASKSRLLESTAELKAAKEKKGVLKDLIADATATKDAIDEAYDSIENANEAVKHAPQMTAMMPTPAPANDSDFFGGWGSDAPAQVPLPNSYDSNHEDIPTPREPDSQPQSMTVAPHAPTNNGKDNNAVEYSQPAPTSSYSSYDGNNDSSPSYVMPVPAPTTDMYSGGGYTLERGVLNREASEGFGEVMGGGPVPSLLNQGMISPSMGGTMLGSSTFDSVPVAVSMKEAEDLRSKSREADDLAQEAEASRKQMVAHLEELRKVADDAENKARSAADKPVKKKGLLGRSGVQKKDAKEIEKLAMDARDKKEAMLLVQSQVKDAESLAKATKQEAERLNKAAEDAQLSAAAAASMQDQPSPHEINGYSFKTPPTPASSFAMGPPLSSQPLQYGIPNNNHTMPDGGFGGPSLGGFDAHVMGTGNGGVDIPTPSGISDPYDNPFE